MRNKLLLVGFVIVAFSLGACKKYLDINTNPNSSTSSTPDLVLPQAIVYTGAMANYLNTYGMQVGGYGANAGGYGGYAANWTYNFTTDYYTSIWSGTYDLLEDLQYVITSTEGSDNYAYYNAAAKILKVYNYQHLVDQYNDIPFTEALSSTNITPSYDEGTAIYPQLADILDSAIDVIENAVYPTSLTSSTDPLFAGDMTSWIQFANTIKLRLIIRASSAVTFSNTTFTDDGFLTDDAIENPGYEQSSGKANPGFSSWVFAYDGSNGSRSWIPSKYIYGYYDGNKLTDAARGAAIYYDFPSTPVNQLGITTDVESAPTVGAWYSGDGTSGSTVGDAIGVMKGFDMGVPLMLAAESYFLQAEADVRGILSGDAQTDFESGITESFHYLYKLSDGTVASGYDYTTDAETYISDNSTSYLANFSLATSTEEQIEAIITQKYIALNMTNCDEGWNEYRRTGYPASGTTAVNNPYGSFASTQSESTRSDHLPTRILYPSSEYSYNGDKVPSASSISPFTSLIFWAQ
ncbi:SusD/RagB family nutrient-binding outer membrane lipoprotein [Parafilimonas sp.]|uniref:SusD/RagB family nutrient-binding outer membrane lipoprotein n=1 Tax=Parafilimonas sp. TaxID=1969739 RepID=UPI0039E4B2A8